MLIIPICTIKYIFYNNIVLCNVETKLTCKIKHEIEENVNWRIINCNSNKAEHPV